MTSDPSADVIASRPLVGIDAIALLQAAAAVVVIDEDVPVLRTCSRAFADLTRLSPGTRLDPRMVSRLGCAQPVSVLASLEAMIAGSAAEPETLPVLARAQALRLVPVRLGESTGAVLLEFVQSPGIPQTSIAALDDAQRAALQARNRDEAVLLTDEDGYTVWVNAAFEVATGYSAEDIVGRKPGSILQGPLTDATTVADVSARLRAREPVRFQILNYRKDGRRRWRAMRIDPIWNDAGRHIGFIASQRDVNAEREARDAQDRAAHRLDFAYSGDTAALWDLDLASGRAWFTGNTGRMLGSEPPPSGREAVFGWLIDHLHPGDRPEMASRLRAHLHHGARLDTIARVADRGERWRWLRFAGEAEADGSGRPSRSMGVILDVSADRFAPDASEAVSRHKAELVSNVTHELRDVLNGVVGSARLLSLMKLEGRQKVLADRIVNGCQSIKGLLDDTLDLARIQSGLLRLSPAPFSPATLCSDVAAAFEDLAEANGLSLQTDIALPPAKVLVGDARRVRQILEIFLSNAVRYTEAGGIVLRAERLAYGDLRLSVTDTGPGIPAEMQGLIFQRYGQAHVAGSAVGGTGLGLSIAGDLAHLLKARIGVDSRLGQGATFWIALPFAEQGAVPSRFRPREAGG